MNTLGETLKEKRLSKKLSIDDVAERLRIRNKYLIQIEEGAIESSNVYMQGYIKNYAAYLKVDIKDFAENSPVNTTIKSNELKESPNVSESDTSPSLAVVAISLVAIFVSVFILLYMRGIDLSSFSFAKKQVEQEEVKNEFEIEDSISTKAKKKDSDVLPKKSNLINKINSYQFVVSKIDKDYKVIIMANSPVEVSVFNSKSELVSRERLDLGETSSFLGKDYEELKFITNSPKAIDISFEKVS
ncbi:MAG: helix-turn-helix domain-containing protein [Rickettsiales bacterium]